MNNTLKKEERLTGKDKLELLYQKGKPLTDFPVKILWATREDADPHVPVKIVFSVPKRKFKSAVKRNRIRRRFKEAYRQNKHELVELLQERKQNISIFVLYLGNEIPNYKSVSDKIIVLLNRLKQDVSESSNYVEEN